MLKKIIFSLILFIAPLFANDALADCYSVTFNVNGGDATGLLNPAYYNPSTELWYIDKACSRSVAATAFLPTRKGYQLRGFWATQLADVSENNTTAGMFVSNNGVVKQAIPKIGATLFAAWAQDCENNCPLTIGEDGSVTYSQGSNPYCYMVTLDANNGTFTGRYNDNKLYFMDGRWYTDSMCANEYTGTTDLVPSRDGYVFRGFYNSLLSDISVTTTAANTSSNLCITNEGDATGICKIIEATTIYAAWAQNCTVPSNGTCAVTAGTDGGVDYNTTCNTGYEPQQDQNTATPSCTKGLECYKITFDYNGGSLMQSQPALYKQQGSTGFFSDENCTTPMTTFPTLKSPTRTGYTLRGFYNTDLADVSENASNGSPYATNTGQLTPLANGWTITDGNSKLYAAWAKNCTVPTNGTCKLEINTGAVTYNASCNSTDYTLSGNGTATPTCTQTAFCYTVVLNVNGGISNGSPTPLYKKTGDTKWYTTSDCSSAKTISKLSTVAAKLGFTFTGYYTSSTAGTQCIESDGTLNTTDSCIFSANTVLYAQYEDGFSGGSCGDEVSVSFWGLGTSGQLTNLTSSATPKFLNSTKKWKKSNGSVVSQFSSLGVTIPTLSKSISVGGTTYAAGLTPYRAQWVGGTPTGIPDGIVAETTVCPSSMNASRDIALDGSLPDISDDIENYSDSANYVILYAANCIDPTGANSNSTCTLTVAGGGASYANACLAGWENPTFFQATQTCIDYVVHDMEPAQCAQ